MAVAGKEAVEDVFVHSVSLQSRHGTAFQVGPIAPGGIRNVALQRAGVSDSHRGIAVQLHDMGDMHNMWYCSYPRQLHISLTIHITILSPLSA